MEAKYIYQLLDENGFDHIKRINVDGTESIIPKDLSNSDYQAYLASLEDK